MYRNQPLSILASLEQHLSGPEEVEKYLVYGSTHFERQLKRGYRLAASLPPYGLKQSSIVNLQTSTDRRVRSRHDEGELIVCQIRGGIRW